ncbi:MAG: hypothetical protein FWH27_07855 [Planctomycetaceae bacterium]|nr:hypothetical protein [Planctomycetaceae bacterium]
MSLQMLYKIDEQECMIPIRMDEICDLMFKKYPEFVDIVYGTEEPDEYSFDSPSATVSVSQLIDATDQLLDRFKNDKELKPYRYVFDCDHYMIKGGDNLTGIRIGENNRCYKIQCGINECKLIEGIIDENGRLLKYGEEIDIRDRQIIETNNVYKELRIRKTKAQSPIVTDLKKLKKFLEQFSGEQMVLKIMV